MDEQERKARIGKKNADGNVIKWPLVDFNGAGYSRPASTQDIGGDEFVVLPPGFKDWDGLKAFKRGGAVMLTLAPESIDSTEGLNVRGKK